MGFVILFNDCCSKVMIAQGALANESLVLINFRTVGSGPILGNGIKWITPILILSIRVVLGISRGPLEGMKNLSTPGGPIPMIPKMLG